MASRRRTHFGSMEQVAVFPVLYIICQPKSVAAAWVQQHAADPGCAPMVVRLMSQADSAKGSLLAAVWEPKNVAKQEVMKLCM